ncbi:MAG TPA: hypothetical protein VGQ85_04900 [Candidatus Limnocylindrales bacterium]|nr:hypothetical protein [Candidatus Limnocylindrales bacterium]
MALGALMSIVGLGLFAFGATQFDGVLVLIASFGLLGPGLVLFTRSVLTSSTRFRTGAALEVAGLVTGLAALFAMSQLGEYRSIIAAYLIAALIGAITFILGLVLFVVSALRGR